MTVLAQGEQGKAADNRGERPLLRGWLHAGAFVAWLIGGPFLIAAGPDAAATAELAVYVAGMLAMFGTSAAFHRLRWSAPAWRRMRRADHSAIFVGIAGTCTAVAGLALRGWAQVLILTLVWVGAAAGIVLRQVFLDAPQWVVAIPYVLVGWCPIIVAPQLVRSLGWAGFALMLAGGLFYTAGALVYAAKRPDPWPRVFGFHEVFHACTLVGAGLFAYLVAFIALPALLSDPSLGRRAADVVQGSTSRAPAVGTRRHDRPVLLDPGVDGAGGAGRLAATAGAAESARATAAGRCGVRLACLCSCSRSRRRSRRAGSRRQHPAFHLRRRHWRRRRSAPCPLRQDVRTRSLSVWGQCP